MKQIPYFFVIIISLFITGNVYAQDFGFGFGFDDENTGSSGSPLAVSVGGRVSASMMGFLDDFEAGAEHIELGDMFSGKLNFKAASSNAEGVINLNINASETPVTIDEGYVRAFFGKFDITAGLRKLTWGKADSFGPLDVINPLDTSAIYTEMADQTDLMGIKIARPMIHASFRLGQFSKIEGVFIPWFEPHRFTTDGRWSVSQMDMLNNIPEYLPVELPVDPWFAQAKLNTTLPELFTAASLDYAQAGLRFTTTIGSADVGIQYYYGWLPQPAVDINFVPPYMGEDGQLQANLSVAYKYNSYHQIGLDYAQVLFGFNVRAEAAANITEDLDGDDGSVYNPSIAWSFGFDRDLFWGINLNMQVTETIRLMHDKIGSNDIESIFAGDFDIEAGLPLTSTRLTAALSKKFFNDELEVRAAVVWGIEDNDCAVMPALIWTKDDIRIAFAGGFFAGDSDGQLGQYKDNHFLKVSIAYTF